MHSKSIEIMQRSGLVVDTHMPRVNILSPTNLKLSILFDESAFSTGEYGGGRCEIGKTSLSK